MRIGCRSTSGSDCSHSSITTSSSSPTPTIAFFTSLGLRSVDPNWFNSVRPDVQPVLDELRGRTRASASAMADACRRPHAPRAPAAGIPRTARHRRGCRCRPIRRREIRRGAEWTGGAERQSHRRRVLAEIASRLQLRNLRKIDDQPAPAGDYVFDLTDPTARRSPSSHGHQSSPAPRSCRASCRSSRSRWPASPCSLAWCCTTCGEPRRRSRPARAVCAISPCTIRCAACPTAFSSASGWKK